MYKCFNLTIIPNRKFLHNYLKTRDFILCFLLFQDIYIHIYTYVLANYFQIENDYINIFKPKAL